MAVNPAIGYDPGASNSPQVGPSGAPATIDQWIYDFAVSAAASMANGTLQADEGSVFSDAFMQANGLNIKFDPADFGNGTQVSRNTFNQLLALGRHLADNWDKLTPAQQARFPSPKGLKPANTGGLSDTDKNNIAAATISAAQDAAAAERAKIQAQASVDVANIGAQASRDTANISAASNERIAKLQAESAEKIAANQLAENRRQFDLSLAENRRQFNITTLTSLFDRGIELASNPVDWLAYQYWLENMDIPLSALSITSAAAVFGAIPPSGPSEAGPLVGGPGIIDGETSLAESYGIQNAGPVPLDEAVAANPGNSVWADAVSLLAQATRAALPADIGQALEEARNDLVQRFRDQPAGQVFGDYVQRMRQQAQQDGGATGQNAWLGLPPHLAAALAPQAPPEDFAQNIPPYPPATPANLQGQPLPTPPAPQAPTEMTVSQSPAGPPPGLTEYLQQVLNQVAPTAETPPPIPGATGGPYTGLEALVGQNNIGQQVAPPATPPPAEGAAGAPPPDYNAAGPAPTQPAATPQQQQQPAQAQQQPAGQGSANIDAALTRLAAELGISVEELRRIFPVHLLAQTQAPGGVGNSPVIQNLQNQTAPGIYNTGPRSGTMFTQLRGFGGVETGVRGGQDVNAAHYLTALEPTQQMMQGVFRAQGLSVPGTLQQMLRSSPITDIPVGAAGRRR